MSSYDPLARRTPWQKAVAKIGVAPAELARRMGRHRSTISRKVTDERGLISGRDQELLFAVAKALDVDLRPEDVTPEPR